MSYENLYTLIENIEGALDTVLVSGFNVINTSTIKTMEEISEQCENAGFSFAGEMLKAMASGQERKRHVMKFNNEEIMKKYFLLNNYILLIKSKIDIEKVNLRSEI